MLLHWRERYGFDPGVVFSLWHYCGLGFQQDRSVAHRQYGAVPGASMCRRTEWIEGHGISIAGQVAEIQHEAAHGVIQPARRRLNGFISFSHRVRLKGVGAA